MPRGDFGRASGDWEDEKQPNPVLRFVLQRSWVLVVPLIAIAWYNARELQPLAKKADTEIAQIKIAGEEKRNGVLSGARRLEVNLSLLRAVGDTFQVRFAKIDSMVDSVTVLRDADAKDLAWLKSRADSLQKSLSETEGKSAELAAKLPPMQATIDSLTQVIAAWNDEIQRLEQARSEDMSLTDRILRPDAYRKNTALVTGHGEFPNRDALPKR